MTALAHVANRAILHHALDDLRVAGVEQVILTGEADTLIEVQGFLDAYSPPDQEISYAVRHTGSTLASTAEAVAPLVGDAACVMQPGDGLLERPIRTLLGRLEAHAPAPVVFAAASAGSDMPHGRLALHTADAPVDTSWSGLGLFTPGSLGTGGGRAISPMRLEEISGWHRYQGNRRELLDLNRIALDRIVSSIPPGCASSNKMEGAIHIDPTASVRESVIIGPVVIGPGATVRDAYIGPWTSIGARARVEGTEIERSIVSPGASITHVGARLIGSLVGRDAQVFKDFSLPRAVRLWVGDGDEIALC